MSACVRVFTLGSAKCNKTPYGTLHLPPFFGLSHKLTCILHPFFNSAQQEIVVKWHWLKSSPFPGGIRAVMNKEKNIKSILQRHNARLIPTEALRPAPCLNQMIVCAQQKPICFPLTLMVVAMALSSPVITTFYFIHASLLRARVFAWTAWVRHIPPGVPLFIVLIFCEGFISFRKSSRKHWMPISCWPVWVGEGAVWEQHGRVQAVGVYGNLANRAYKKNRCLYTNCLHLPSIGIAACFLLTAVVHLYMRR